MGTRNRENRERRQAKQQAREARARAQADHTAKAGDTGPTGDPAGHAGWFDQERDHRTMLRETADMMIAEAVNAYVNGLAAAVAAQVRNLAAAPAGSSGHQVVNQALTGWLERTVSAAWRRGWQPADLHRFASREIGSRSARMTIDFVAEMMRGYDAATVDERWDAQLQTLDATVWWGDDELLNAWGTYEGRGRAEVIHDVIELIVLIHGLPTIQMLGPLPGAARRGARGPVGDPRVLDRVRALLAKAESTTFAEEAEALTTKAQQLMARYSIDDALLAARGSSASASTFTSADEPGASRIGIGNPYEEPKAILLNVIAEANRCRSIWVRNLGFMTVIGYPTDLEAVELLYTSLLVQATAAVTRAGGRQDRYGRSRTRAFRKSFLISFATRIGERLATATEQAGADAAAASGDSRLLPALAARNDSVREAAERMFPEVVAKTVNAADVEGGVLGRAAADLASLSVRDEVADASANVADASADTNAGA
ncbi:Protein of unknown function (DUF2786) [Parafrankia irregularis]|uniref:Uncharacterized protein n=1 Tax=Parafrankia irregularis TaxID=795642 RepID=A0A0S4QHK2_9ACTN|nr:MULTISPECIES: DUF2786 domain-containing protein [Parafrankia]MBE3203235.1 DUF2786 domain-containing protein [Parafrankia sp. CH37]CUU54118.1 Protein of unknown function (DUF2786) [Parafrankia irregularis]